MSQKKSSEAKELLRRAGIKKPIRTVELIRDTIKRLSLDLKGFTVLTEAASGPFVVTPVIAALAGAKVIGLTRNSRYGSVEEVTAQTRALEMLSGLDPLIKIEERQNYIGFSEADIVTNLGFVRPIDSQVIEAMKPSAAIPLMCESWEFRPGDLDFEFCRKKGIVVLGTNEEAFGVDVFNFSGILCLKMLLEAQIAVRKSRILVVSGDRFGRVIEAALQAVGARVKLVADLKSISPLELESAEAMVVADYTRSDMIVGPEGDITSIALARYAPEILILQFAGRIHLSSLLALGIEVYPGIELEARRMARTLADLGPRPVIELHSAGLKVGQAIAEARAIQRLDPTSAIAYALENSPAQQLM